ncbi:MAG: hypothetical protein LAP87_28440 [Acidobacteriia bacterium]|nr:hypothetical protein [Terriglobia bacterium]
MRRLPCFLVSLVALPLLASAADWTGTIMDVHCKGMDPAMHTRECALHGAKQGLGLATADGKFLKFDKSGNAKALAAINASKEEKLTAQVTGTLKGDTIHVESVQITAAQTGETATGMAGHGGMGMGMSHGAMGMGMQGGKGMDCPMMKMSAPAAKSGEGGSKPMDMSAPHECCCHKMGAAAAGKS